MKQELQRNLRGELTEPANQNPKYQVPEEHFLETLATTMNAPELQSAEV